MKRPSDCSCRCAPPVLVDWNRHMLNADPVAGDTTVSGYTTDWTFGAHPLWFGSTWHLTVFGTTPDDTPVGSQGHWNRKMRPMRFTLTSVGSLFAIYREISESASPSGGSAIMNNPKFYPPPASDIGPPLAGHFVGSETSEFSVSLPFACPISSSITARYIRLWVDGVDITGALSISHVATLQQIRNALYNFSTTTVNTSPVNVTGKAIEVDIWVELDVTVPSGTLWSDGYTYYPAVFAFEGTVAGRYANSTQHYIHFIRGIDGLDVNALFATSRDYQFTFSSAISSTETVATTVSASPWTVTRDGLKATLAHSNGNDKVILYYGQEIAEIVVNQYQAHSPFNFLIWSYRYVPASTGHYASDSGVQPGIFTPNALQTFNLIGWTVSGGTTWNTNTSSVSGWCPTSITVEPYP